MKERLRGNVVGIETHTTGAQASPDARMNQFRTDNIRSSSRQVAAEHVRTLNARGGRLPAFVRGARMGRGVCYCCFGRVSAQPAFSEAGWWVVRNPRQWAPII